MVFSQVVRDGGCYYRAPRVPSAVTEDSFRAMHVLSTWSFTFQGFSCAWGEECFPGCVEGPGVLGGTVR